MTENQVKTVILFPNLNAFFKFSRRNFEKEKKIDLKINFSSIYIRRESKWFQTDGTWGKIKSRQNENRESKFGNQGKRA